MCTIVVTTTFVEEVLAIPNSVTSAFLDILVQWKADSKTIVVERTQFVVPSFIGCPSYIQ